MIHHHKHRLGAAPALLVYENRPDLAARQGCILFFHGLGVSKEENWPELESLAGRGFLVVGLDNVGHGRRRYADFDDRFAESNPDMSKNFMAAVLETAQEVPPILDELDRAGLIVEGRVGVVGISMGGYITYTAITQEPRLQVAASILGSPRWKIDRAESPHRRLDRFSTIKLISQNAGRDEKVPAGQARVFHERLKERYPDHRERLAYFEYPDSGHFMTPADWDLCWQRTGAWFERHFQGEL